MTGSYLALLRCKRLVLQRIEAKVDGSTAASGRFDVIRHQLWGFLHPCVVLSSPSRLLCNHSFWGLKALAVARDGFGKCPNDAW